MKLATLKKGGRDGTLVVVKRAMTHCQAVPAIVRTTLQQGWKFGDTVRIEMFDRQRASISTIEQQVQPCTS
ncbi:MAG: hypothetical protein A3E79_16140 [Burkholderiales bacterium RIFCSPHIGHO2_12_FULL_61_11]|nr:MAG: hypothetical protein A3E79_16140 [Burkholderiales bacterium RIFCSPHIGHO2_12_FULL_61_11]